jgi:hypothetical protein
MPVIFASSGEVFYLRALLAETTPTSFDEMLVDASNLQQRHTSYQVQQQAIPSALTMYVAVVGSSTGFGAFPRHK